MIAILGSEGDGLQDQNLYETAATFGRCGCPVQPEEQVLGGLQVALSDEQTGERQILDFIQISNRAIRSVQATRLCPAARSFQIAWREPGPGLVASRRGSGQKRLTPYCRMISSAARIAFWLPARSP